VLLPAFAYSGGTTSALRFALRSAVILATLQVLVAYPVAGSQITWATVAMVVPCGIALAVASERYHVWRDADWRIRGGTVAMLGITLAVATGLWPVGIWNSYANATSVDLPGAGLMRIDADTVTTLHGLVEQIQANCDTFYGIPNENSLYIFSGVPAVTGQVANAGTGGLTEEQRDRIEQALKQKEAAGKRVCVVRDAEEGALLPAGNLTRELDRYSVVVAAVASYTISIRE
jgi:hypothetical protein